MQDPFSNVTPVQALAPQDITSDTTTNGSDIVRNDSFGLLAVLEVGNYTSGNFQLNVQHADDDGSGNPDSWSDVADKYLRGTEAGTNLSGAGTSKIGYVGSKEHVRFNVVSAGGTADGTVAVTAIKTHLKHSPDTAQTV